MRKLDEETRDGIIFWVAMLALLVFAFVFGERP
jgi:hypothetical protein